MQGRIVVLRATDPMPATGPAEPLQSDPPSSAAHPDPPASSSRTATRADSNLLDPNDDAANLDPCSPIAPSLWPPVPPAIGPLPPLHGGPDNQTSALALEFMAWVQRGVADGSLLQ